MTGGAPNTFRIPTLWGASRTAPYFHDNSAETLEELVQHYDDIIVIDFGVRLGFSARLSAQDKTDIVAFMNLL